MFIVRQSFVDGSAFPRCHARSVPDRQLPAASGAVLDAILRLADVPHSVVSTGRSSTADPQQGRLMPGQVRTERGRPPRGPGSSPRRRVSAGGQRGVRPLSSDTHGHLRAAAGTPRSATPSPHTPSRLSFRVERMTQTLDRLERAASDFDLRLLAEKSTTLPKSDGRGSRRAFLTAKGGVASDGDDVDSAAGRLTGKRRKHFRFRNPFRSADKSTEAPKLPGRKTLGRKMWENCV